MTGAGAGAGAGGGGGEEQAASARADISPAALSDQRVETRRMSSSPRVKSDTLYQPDTQSRAVQDIGIIASSRLFSMGNLPRTQPMMTILIFGAACTTGR